MDGVISNIGLPLVGGPAGERGVGVGERPRGLQWDIRWNGGHGCGLVDKPIGRGPFQWLVLGWVQCGTLAADAVKVDR